MKHLFITIILALLMAGCSKAPVRSDVEGFWKLREYTIISTGEKVECSNLYYSITHMITEVSERNVFNGYGTFLARTEYADDETVLVLKDFRIRGGIGEDSEIGTGDNGGKAPVESLRHYGINSQEETRFAIVKCSKGRMTLRSDYAELTLEKF